MSVSEKGQEGCDASIITSALYFLNLRSIFLLYLRLSRNLPASKTNISSTEISVYFIKFAKSCLVTRTTL